MFPLPHSWGRSIRYSNRLYAIRMSLSTVSFLAQLHSGIRCLQNTFLRSNYSQMFFKKVLLENFAIFRGKDLCWSHFLITLQAFRLKLHTGVFLWIPFFKTPPVADSALTYDLNGLKSRVNRHLLSFLNSFPIRFLSFSFLLFVTPCLVVAVQPCMDLIPIKKRQKYGVS